MFDLHTHTSASDGKLAPVDLVARARERDVSVLSITDHDTLDGYADLGPLPPGLTLIPGIEFSARWERTGIHILGLNVQLEAPSLLEAVAGQGQARRRRAERIASKLENLCGENPLPAITAETGEDGWIGRPDFARYLVRCGLVPDTAEAFRRYLGAGKIGDVRQEWPDMARVVQWIQAAGGVAVLAHPAKYGFTNSRLRRLVAAFKTCGGGGIEVVSGQQNSDLTRHLGRLCADAGLLASCGSDFHRPDVPWSELGAFPALPKSVTPVWHDW